MVLICVCAQALEPAKEPFGVRAARARKAAQRDHDELKEAIMLQQGRRGGAVMDTSGSFTMGGDGGANNRSGNEEEVHHHPPA